MVGFHVTTGLYIKLGGDVSQCSLLVALVLSILRGLIMDMAGVSYFGTIDSSWLVIIQAPPPIQTIIF